MMKNISLLDQASGAAAHAAKRQRVVAENIANADTPGYRARDIPDFAQTQSRAPMKATRASHFQGNGHAASVRAHIVASEMESPNGNNVSLEEEMIRATKAEGQHNLALTIYAKSLDLMRLGLGRRS